MRRRWTGAQDGSQQPRRRTPADRLGFRRIEAVEIILDDHGSRAFVLGVAHRLPHALPVSWRLAAEIAGGGVPVRTVDRRRQPVAGVDVR